MIRAFCRTEAASCAPVSVFHYIQQLQLRLAVEDFKQVAEQTERAEQNEPWNACSDCFEYGIHGKKRGNPYPEFQGIRCGSERTDIPRVFDAAPRGQIYLHQKLSMKKPIRMTADTDMMDIHAVISPLNPVATA